MTRAGNSLPIGWVGGGMCEALAGVERTEPRAKAESGLFQELTMNRGPWDSLLVSERQSGG